MSSDIVADLLLMQDNMYILDKLKEKNDQLSSCLMTSENSLKMNLPLEKMQVNFKINPGMPYQ